MGTLYVVATPIGNLEDITYRAVRILREVDLICCEDTRHTKILLDRYEINPASPRLPSSQKLRGTGRGTRKPQLISYHQHSKITKIDYIIGELKSGKNVALVSDAGTPGINDPGGVLVQKVIEYNSNKVIRQNSHSEFIAASRRRTGSQEMLKQVQHDNSDYITIIPIPGSSAITTLLSVSGFPADRFLFLGFLPKKKGRKTLLNRIKNYELGIMNEMPIVFYESPYRLIRTLEDFQKIGNWQAVIGRELTKKFEEIFRGNIVEAIEHFSKSKPKGEFTVIIRNSQFPILPVGRQVSNS